MGVELRLENGLIGVIRNKDISSSETIEDPTTRMAIDQVVTGRITQIDHERFKGMVLIVINDSVEPFDIVPTCKGAMKNRQSLHFDKVGGFER